MCYWLKRVSVSDLESSKVEVDVYTYCIACNVELNSDNRSSVKNVCRECLHSLEF